MKMLMAEHGSKVLWISSEPRSLAACKDVVALARRDLDLASAIQTTLLRAYPEGFASRIYDLRQANAGRARTTLRQKIPLDANFTDQDLFKQIPLGDRWDDARLVEVFFYLLQSHSLSIPDSWHDTIMDFKTELEAFEHW